MLRIHQEDMCQELSIHPENKYQAEGGPGVGQIAQLLRSSLPPGAVADAVERFRDALAWNWLIGGTDAHAKNYSLLLSGNHVRLAPLYDVASALPYGDERGLRFAMKIGNDYRVADYSNPWPVGTQELGLPLDATMTRVRDLAERVIPAFEGVAQRENVRSLNSTLPERLVTALGKRVQRCLGLIWR